MDVENLRMLQKRSEKCEINWQGKEQKKTTTTELSLDGKGIKKTHKATCFKGENVLEIVSDGQTDG